MRNTSKKRTQAAREVGKIDNRPMLRGFVSFIGPMKIISTVHLFRIFFCFSTASFGNSVGLLFLEDEIPFEGDFSVDMLLFRII